MSRVSKNKQNSTTTKMNWVGLTSQAQQPYLTVKSRKRFRFRVSLSLSLIFLLTSAGLSVKKGSRLTTVTVYPLKSVCAIDPHNIFFCLNHLMKYLLFHSRNLKFALILNTIYSTKLNCKRLWKIGPIITNNITATAKLRQQLGSRLKHLLVKNFGSGSISICFNTKTI